MTGSVHILTAVGSQELGEGIGSVGVLGVGGNAHEGVGDGAAHVVGLALLVHGIGSVGDLELRIAGHDVTGQDGLHGGGVGAVQEHIPGLGAVGQIVGLGVPDALVLGVDLTLQNLGEQVVVEIGVAVGSVEGVHALALTDGVGPVVGLVEVGAAVYDSLAVSALLGHLPAGIQVLIPGPGGRNLAQAGSVPLVLVDGDIDGQAAGGESVHTVLILVGIGAPLLHQVQVVLGQAIGDVHEQAVGPTVGGVADAEAQDHVHVAGHDGGIGSHVAVAVVLVDFVLNLHVGIVLVELFNQCVSAVCTGESGVEADGAGQLGGVVVDVLGFPGRLGSGGLGVLGVGRLGSLGVGGCRGVGGGVVRRLAGAAGEKPQHQHEAKNDGQGLFHFGFLLKNFLVALYHGITGWDGIA